MDLSGEGHKALILLILAILLIADLTPPIAVTP